jgi:hypothetical protein
MYVVAIWFISGSFGIFCPILKYSTEKNLATLVYMNEGVPATVSSDWLMVFLSNRVARLFVFKPKIPLWVNFGEPYIGKCLHIYMTFIFIGYVMTIRYIFPILVSCTKKNLATLLSKVRR